MVVPVSFEPQVLNLVQDSLLRRMRTMHGLCYQAVGWMELEHSTTSNGRVCCR